ncbi:5435_t:CDS:1, partial [Cetraspora pellucida]
RIDKEQQMPGSFPGQPTLSKFKILLAHQFCYVREVMKKKEIGAEEAFQELVKEMTDESKELIFIPVNQPNYHWSLLVYETKSKQFYHWDTLGGVNEIYIKPLIKELLRQIHSTSVLNQFLIKRYEIRQNNSYDCGVAVIALIKRIKEKYAEDLENIQLGRFELKKERERLREKYLQEINP